MTLLKLLFSVLKCYASAKDTQLQQEFSWRSKRANFLAASSSCKIALSQCICVSVCVCVFVCKSARKARAFHV